MNRRLTSARLRADGGESPISALALLAGVLLPLLFVVPLTSRLELARLACEQAARDAVRAAAQEQTPAAAERAAQAAVAAQAEATRLPLRLEIRGSLRRDGRISTIVSVRVRLVRLPGSDPLPAVLVQGRAWSPIDRYRSLPPP